MIELEIEIEINNLVDEESGSPDPAWQPARWQQVLNWVLADAGFTRAEISIAVVDDRQMRELNQRYLQHDYTTDVLSFRLDEAEHPGPEAVLEGELIICCDTARRAAEECGWSVADELLLYVLHGGLHLVGHDDATDEERGAMRGVERNYLERLEPELGRRYAASLERSAER